MNDARHDPGPATPVLSAAGLTVRFGGRPALAGVSLDIPRGEIVALIGPSGSGKTTLLRALCRMNELIPAAVTTGSVRFEGTELYAPEVDPAEVRRRIGVVLQDAALFPGSIFHNVAFGPRASGFEGDLHALAEEVLATVGLWAEVGGDLDLPASALSAGQRRRLCIARTLAVRPRVLLLDEPAFGAGPRGRGAHRVAHPLPRRQRGGRRRHERPAAGRARVGRHGPPGPRRAGGMRPHRDGVHQSAQRTHRVLPDGADPMTDYIPAKQPFELKLDRLHNRLMEIGGRAEELLRLAMEGLEKRDVERARQVRRADARINELDIEIDERSLELLALQNPMAGDLRFIFAVLKATGEIERIADHAVNIANAGRRAALEPPLPDIREIREIGAQVRSMLSRALGALVNRDPDDARAVIAEDPLVDDMRNSAIRTILSYMSEQPRYISPGVNMILVIQNLERIGDLATNIAEDAVFLVEGRSIKHADPAATP